MRRWIRNFSSTPCLGDGGPCTLTPAIHPCSLVPPPACARWRKALRRSSRRCRRSPPSCKEKARIQRRDDHLNENAISACAELSGYHATRRAVRGDRVRLSRTRRVLRSSFRVPLPSAPLGPLPLALVHISRCRWGSGSVFPLVPTFVLRSLRLRTQNR